MSWLHLQSSKKVLHLSFCGGDGPIMSVSTQEGPNIFKYSYSQIRLGIKTWKITKRRR